MRLLGFIGKGVYGSVFATDAGAVKVLKEHDNYEDEVVTRTRELFVGSLNPDRLVYYFPVTREFAVLSPIGYPLSMVAPAGLWSVEERRTLGKALIDEIVRIHDLGIIHRDLKPDNVVVHWNPFRMRLIDFGISTVAKESRESQVYSLWYRPPEVYKKRPYSEKADIWAFGVMLASWCGKQELICKTEKELDDEINNLNVWKPDMQNLIYLCLQKNPDKRPSAREVAAHSFWSGKQTKIPECTDPIYHEKIYDVPDPKIFYPPVFSGVKVSVFQCNVAVNIGKKCFIRKSILEEALLIACCGSGKGREEVAAAVYIACCVFSDCIPAMRDFAKEAHISVPSLCRGIDNIIYNSGGSIFAHRQEIFQSEEWSEVRRILNKHFD
jgi:hypothetical protein